MAWTGGLWLSTLNSNIKPTPLGGIAIKVINNTGAPSFQGGIVKTSPNIDGAVILCPVGNPDPMGVMLDDNVPNGLPMWIVISGKAKVFFVNAATKGLFARMTASGDTGAAAGKAICEAVPFEPFSVDKHFQEVGHVLETTGGSGLALINIHFN
jgi:hypothetical protein